MALSDFDDFLNAPSEPIKQSGLSREARAQLAEQTKATQEKYAAGVPARARKVLSATKTKNVRLSNTYSFTCSEEVFTAIEGAIEDRSRARSKIVRNALITYLNLTMLERKEVWAAQRKDLGVLGNGPKYIALALKEPEVRERLEHIVNKDGMSVSEVFRRALWYFINR